MTQMWSVLWAVVGVSALAGCGGARQPVSNLPSSTPISAIDYDALFVVNGGSHSISIIDASTNEVTGTVLLNNVTFPHHINASADLSEVVVAVPGMDMSGGHEGSGHGASLGVVLRLDARTGRTIGERRLQAANHNGIFSPDGKEIWTSQMQMPGRVLVLDAVSLEPRQAIAVGDMPAEVTFSKDGRFGFVANTMSNSVTVIDPATKAVVKTIPVGRGPVGAWTGTDGLMYVDNEASKTLTLIDSASLDTVGTIQLGFTPGMAATAPNGEMWVTDSENGRVAFYSAGGGKKLGEQPTGAGAHAMAFSGDGKVAYVSNQTAGTVSVIDVATRAVTKSVAVGSKPNGMLFRPK